MARVYEAVDSQGRKVALKVLPPELSLQPVFVTRFRREILALKTLRHPNIVRVLAVGEEEATPWYAMEYVSEGSLDDRLGESARLSVDEVLNMGKCIGRALEYAHDKGVIHRDIKPGNVMFDAQGEAKLTDFGIAKVVEATRMTQTGGIIGTVEYMSPEQAEGRNVDKRTDIYSLGVVMYEALTGQVPFRGANTIEVIRAHRFKLPESIRNLRPEVPKELARLVEQMLEKEPQRRIESARAFLKELERVEMGAKWERLSVPEAAGEVLEGTALGRVAREALAPSREERAYRAIIWAGVLTAVLIVTGLVIWQMWANRPGNLYARALALAKENRRARAEFLLNNIIKRHPESPYAEKSQAKLREWRQQRADKSLRRAVAFIQVGNMDAAVAECKRVLANYSDLSEGREAEAFLEHMRQRREEGLAFTTAEDLFEDAEETYEEESYEEALAKFRLVIRLYPQSEFAEKAEDAAKKIEALLRDAPSAPTSESRVTNQ